MRKSGWLAGLSLVLVVMTSVGAHAQWVAVARHVSGRIQQMAQQNANGTGGFDVATVVIEAPARKVYDTALERLMAHADEVKILKMDKTNRVVAFTNGGLTASLQANVLNETTSQLVVASTLDPSQPSATSLVVKSIQNVCTELKVECELVKP